MRHIFRKRAWLAVAALGLLLIVVVAVRLALGRSAPGSPAAEAAASPRLQTVGTVMVARRDLARSITITSELHPYQTVKLYAKVAGYLKDIDVDYGSRVSAGQTIATLELPEQQADVERTSSALNLARVNYDRLLAVNRESPGLVPQVDIDKAQADYEMARDQNSQASIILGYSSITAPFSGVITKRYADPGALISQGTSSMSASPIVDLSDDYHLRMVVETPESVVPYVRVGMPVTMHIPAVGGTLHERVARYSYDVHEDTRTMHTEIDVQNEDLRLKPGMYASVTMDLQNLEDVVALPTQAVATDTTPNVWIVDNDGTLRERPVKIGLQTANWDQILSGIAPGAKVVVGDRSALTLGSKVEPKMLGSQSY